MINILNEILYTARLVDYGRSCDLLWFNFAKDNQEIYIHCQCFVRVVDNNKIVATSSEIYISQNDDETFNWEVFNDSYYDINIKNFFKDRTEIQVKKFYKVGINDFVVLLCNGVQIQLLNDKSTDDELWRIIYGKKHYVCQKEISEE